MRGPFNAGGADPRGVGGEYLERVQALAPQIEACADQIERERRLPSALLAALIDAGLFRLLLPRSLDGAEVDPVTFVRVIEAVSSADASTAWCLCQTAGCSMVAAYLRPGRALGGPGRPLGATALGPALLLHDREPVRGRLRRRRTRHRAAHARCVR